MYIYWFFIYQILTCFTDVVVVKQKSKESLTSPPVVSPDRPMKRHRHASSQSCKGSMSTHLVLVDIHDTLGVSWVCISIMSNQICVNQILVDSGFLIHSGSGF